MHHHFTSRFLIYSLIKAVLLVNHRYWAQVTPHSSSPQWSLFQNMLDVIKWHQLWSLISHCGGRRLDHRGWACESDLRQVVLRLGSFHTEMGFVDSIGHLMAESCLKELLELIDAPTAVVHILTGEAIAWAYLLVDAALNTLILSKPLRGPFLILK